jgi:hypothetical protein
VLILVHSAPVSLLRDHGRHPNLGVLSSPRRVYLDDVQEWLWAADNDAYLAWDADLYQLMLNKITGMDGCLFITAPDVVGDAEETLRRFWEWLPAIRRAQQPVALVAQDGIHDTELPWDDIDALFIGGTTPFKMHTETLCREAKRRGKWLHMGRVNTRRRIRFAQSIGCDSVDGSSFSMFRRTHLPWALQMCESRQLALAVKEETP